MQRRKAIVLRIACLAGGTLLVVSSPAVSQEAAYPTDRAPAAAARWTPSGAATGGGYRWSLTRGAIDLGVRFDARPAAAHPADARFDSAAPPGSTLPALSLGVQSVSADPGATSSLADRALGTAAAVPYVSKLGLEWKPASSRVFVNQGLGLRLAGDDRLTMRLRKGLLGIYMKRDF